MPVLIENLLENDVEDILNIQSETNLSVWKSEDYKNQIDRVDSLCLIARSDKNEVFGFAVARLLAEKTDIYDTAEILNIAVRKSFQNKGVGQKLFDKIKFELNKRGISEVWLEVRRSNQKAIKFYKKNGFDEQFVRKNYYVKPKEDALILKMGSKSRNLNLT